MPLFAALGNVEKHDLCLVQTWTLCLAPPLAANNGYRRPNCSEIAGTQIHALIPCVRPCSRPRNHRAHRQVTAQDEGGASQGFRFGWQRLGRKLRLFYFGDVDVVLFQRCAGGLLQGDAGVAVVYQGGDLSGTGVGQVALLLDD